MSALKNVCLSNFNVVVKIDKLSWTVIFRQSYPYFCAQAFNRHIPVLIRALGSSNFELLAIISDPPQGSENLLMLVGSFVGFFFFIFLRWYCFYVAFLLNLSTSIFLLVAFYLPRYCKFWLKRRHLQLIW